MGLEVRPRRFVKLSGWDMHSSLCLPVILHDTSSGRLFASFSLGLGAAPLLDHVSVERPPALPDSLMAGAGSLPRASAEASFPIPPQPGVCLQTVLDHLMQRYEETGTAYLNISLLRQMPSQLLNPGPAPSVAGDLQLVEDLNNEGQLQLYFQLPPGRTLQVVQYDDSMQAYSIVEDPW